MSVNLEQIVVAGEARKASVAGEVAGYLILAAADELARAPREFSAEDVSLDERGTVSVGRGRACESEQTALLLREYLGELLGVSRPLPPALLRATRKSSGQVADLIRELEAALIPVNRAAARRALSRLQREVTQAEQTAGQRELRPRQVPAPQIHSRVEMKARRPELRHAEPQAVAHEPPAPRQPRESRVAREPQTEPAPPRWAEEPVELPAPPRVPSLDYPPVRVLEADRDEVTALQPCVARKLARQVRQADSRFEQSLNQPWLQLTEGEATERIPDVAAYFGVDSGAQALELQPTDGSDPSADQPSADQPSAVQPSAVQPAGPPISGSSRVCDRKSDVSQLLSGFVVAEQRSDEELGRELKAMAGLELTPIAAKYG